MRRSNNWAIVLAGGEGTRVRGFLKQLCGGSGLKQFSSIIGRRSMLQHTLDRMQQLVPAERILVVVGANHRKEAEQQLAHWPRENVIYQRSRSGGGVLAGLNRLAQPEFDLPPPSA